MAEENAKIVPYADGGETRYFLTCPKCGSAEEVAAGTTRCPGCGNHAAGVRVVGHACKLDGSICESRPDRCSDCPAGAGGKS